MVARTAATRKAKGTRLENAVAAAYRTWGIDETARRMPLSGAMSHFKSDIYKRNDYEWVDECKNHESINVKRFWEQTIAQSTLKTPVLHISSNFRPIITVLTQADFEQLAEANGFERFNIIDINEKKRWNFWAFAEQCTDLSIQATVVYCTITDEALVLMTMSTYMKLRVEDMALQKK
ncbi:MAG: putative PDDEXK endonuclease [Candidatus Saccharimonadaceae bacterium]